MIIIDKIALNKVSVDLYNSFIGTVRSYCLLIHRFIITVDNYLRIVININSNQSEVSSFSQYLSLHKSSSLAKALQMH